MDSSKMDEPNFFVGVDVAKDNLDLFVSLPKFVGRSTEPNYAFRVKRRKMPIHFGSIFI